MGNLKGNLKMKLLNKLRDLRLEKESNLISNDLMYLHQKNDEANGLGATTIEDILRLNIQRSSTDEVYLKKP